MNAKSTLIRQTLEEQYPHLRGIVARIARNEGVVDDIVQECCARIIQKEDLWNGDVSKAGSWMGRISRNLTLRYLSSQKQGISLDDDRVDILVEDAAEDPVDEERVRWVLRQYSTLPERQRDILVLKYLEGFDNTEIAEQLGIAPQTVSTHLARAIATLRGRARSAGLLSWLLPFGLLSRTGELNAGVGAKIALASTASLAIGGGAVWWHLHDEVDRVREEVSELKTALVQERHKVAAPVVTPVEVKTNDQSPPAKNVAKEPDVQPVRPEPKRPVAVPVPVQHEPEVPEPVKPNDRLMRNFDSLLNALEQRMTLSFKNRHKLRDLFVTRITTRTVGEGAPSVAEVQSRFESGVREVLGEEGLATLAVLEEARLKVVRDKGAMRLVAVVTRRIPSLSQEQKRQLEEGFKKISDQYAKAPSPGASVGLITSRYSPKDLDERRQHQQALIRLVLNKDQYAVYRQKFGVRK